jgi:hypothetical protein
MNHLIQQIISVIIENSNKGTTPIVCHTMTTPPMNKKGNPFFGKVKKVSHIGGLIGINYENSVNNQLEREDKETDFVTKERKWGFHDEENPFIIRHTKKGETAERFYLQIKVQQTHSKPFYLNTETLQVVPTEEIKPYLKDSYSPKTQDGLKKKIVMRDYEIVNLKKISIGGKKFSFDENDEFEVTIMRISDSTKVEIPSEETVMV